MLMTNGNERLSCVLSMIYNPKMSVWTKRAKVLWGYDGSGDSVHKKLIAIIRITIIHPVDCCGEGKVST